MSGSQSPEREARGPAQELGQAEALRALPAVESLLGSACAEAAIPALGRAVVREHCRAVIERWRAALRAGLEPARLHSELAGGALERELAARLEVERGAGCRPAVNATGVVLHTGLGRAPLHSEAARAMQAVARSFATVEVDRESGQRNQRDERLGQLAQRATGAEAAIAVNNCAAAVLLALNTFASGRAALVSRGELVEIGGSFRMPDVMQKAAAKLVEVGTTNRTRIADYERALTPEAALLLKVHPSNFRVRGFTETTSAAELVELGRRRGLSVVYDVGSGLVDFPGARALDMLADEVRVQDAVAAGVDVVLFSGDKLFGGAQAGFAVGRAAAVAAMRANPLYRALRLDKVSVAGLERTLELALCGRADELPVRAMLARTQAELARAAEALAAELARRADLEVQVVASTSQPGSGSAACVELPSAAVAVRWQGGGADLLALHLRRADPPVFARIHEGRVLLDPRAFLPGDEAAVCAAFAALPAGPAG